MDPELALKKFCDNINLRFTDEYFLMHMQSGIDSCVYALTPAHAKRLRMALTHFVDLYEEKYGAIKAEWSPNVPSPIQVEDIKAGRKPKRGKK